MSRSSDEAGAARPHGRDRRAFYRVRARIPLRRRPLESSEREAVEREILTPRAVPADLEPTVAAWMERIERKLELVLSCLDDSVTAPLGARDLTPVEISASGMRLEAKDAAPVGTDELVEFQLPGSRPRDVRAIARVVDHIDGEEEGDDPHVALAFRVIDEDDREAIVRFANDVQRRTLRVRSARRRE